MLPAWAVTAWVIASGYAQQRDQLVANTIGTARLLMMGIERDLAAAESSLEVLALSPYLAAGDLAAFQREAREVLKHQTGNGIVLTDRDGQQLMSTLVPYGKPLPRSGAAHLLARIIETGAPVAADFYIGATSKRPQAAVGVPVFRKGEVAYALTMGFLPERLARTLAVDQLPPGSVAALLDAKGTIVARTQAAERFVGRQASAPLLEELSRRREGTVEGRNQEGVPVLVAFSRSESLRWTVGIGIPMRELTAGLRKALWVSVVAAALLFLIGVYVPRLVSLRVERSIRMALDAAERDALTGLSNRLAFSHRLDAALERARRTGKNLALLFIDLDSFKAVNDTLGHATGDALLKEIGLRLRATIRATDSAARLGGDEFVVLLEEVGDRSNGVHLAEKILEALRAPMRVGDKDVQARASLGIAFADASVDAATLLKRADEALYEAKNAGRNGYRIAG